MNGTANGAPPALRTKEVARRAGVTPQTVIRWADQGKFPGLWRTAGGDRRYPVTSVADLLDQLGIPHDLAPWQ